MDAYQYLMLASSMILSVQLIPQNYKIYKSKSAKDISHLTVGITLSGISGIITYGVHMGLVELWAPAIVQIVLSGQTLLMKLYYDNKQSTLLEPERNNNDIQEEIDNAMRSQVIIGIRQRAADEHLEQEFKFLIN